MIANTIIQQLGNICLNLLGAHTLIDLKDGLQFHIQGSDEVDVIQVILHPSDTYILKFWKIKTDRRKLTKDIPFTTTSWHLVNTRLASYHGLSKKDTIEQLILKADQALRNSLSDDDHDAYIALNLSNPQV